MSQQAAERRSWSMSRRLKIALVLAVLEGIYVAVATDFSRLALVLVSAPIIAFYFLAGRNLDSQLGRDLSWTAAATQTFAVLFAIISWWLHVLTLVVAGVFAVIALILLVGEKPGQTTGRS